MCWFDDLSILLVSGPMRPPSLISRAGSVLWGQLSKLLLIPIQAAQAREIASLCVSCLPIHWQTATYIEYSRLTLGSRVV
jgi:hypothetical protein